MKKDFIWIFFVEKWSGNAIDQIGSSEYAVGPKTKGNTRLKTESARNLEEMVMFAFD